MLEVILQCMVRSYSDFEVLMKTETDERTEIKLVVAAVYSNFRTYIVDDEGIEQMDGYTTGPMSNRLFLRFEKVVDQ